jgi:hypothetical protein
MAQAAAIAAVPSREDFAKLIDESFGHGNLQEGAVVKGTVVAIERDLAVIDVGLKTEGRVALREFAGPGRTSEIKVGDTVEVYLERIENALGEAVLSRDKARREESWGKLEKAFQNNEKVQGSKWTAAAAISLSRAAPCLRKPAPSSARSWCKTSKRVRSSTGWSRTSPTTAPSSISAASTGSCMSPISPGGASIIRPRCSISASR